MVFTPVNVAMVLRPFTLLRLDPPTLLIRQQVRTLCSIAFSSRSEEFDLLSLPSRGEGWLFRTKNVRTKIKDPRRGTETGSSAFCPRRHLMRFGVACETNSMIIRPGPTILIGLLLGSLISHTSAQTTLPAFVWSTQSLVGGGSGLQAKYEVRRLPKLQVIVLGLVHGC